MTRLSTRHSFGRCYTVSGVRVSWKMVPAVHETRRRQSAHLRARRFISHETTHPQCGQANPSGQRNPSR
jgi:hypothetical protein